MGGRAADWHEKSGEQSALQRQAQAVIAYIRF